MKKLNNLINLNAKMKTQNTFEDEMLKKHEEDLGLSLPKDYFLKSKAEILEKVSNKKEFRFGIFTKERMLWSIAASVAVLLSLTVFKPNTLPVIDKIPAIVSDTVNGLKNNWLAQENFMFDDKNILISSLFVEDNEIDDFVNDYVMDEFIFEEVMSN